MLHFSNQPDEPFGILFHESLDNWLRGLSLWDDDLLAKAGQFYPAETREHLTALKSAFTETTLYQLTEYHWYLVYDAVLSYSEMFNLMPELSRLHAQYGLGLVDFYALADVFFADADFLGYPTGGLTAERRQIWEDPMERRALGVGVTPPPRDKLAMPVCPEEVSRGFETAQAKVYLTEIGAYPNVPESRY